MKEKLLDISACPKCAGNITLQSSMNVESYGEIKEGTLICSSCNSEFLIKNYIPRFAHSENYAESFGFQWLKHSSTQIDDLSGIDLSRDRFFQVTKWPTNLKGQRILEAGCGAGRFTEVALKTGAEVFSFDYSMAVDANLHNNGRNPRLHLFQGDIYNIPLQKASFDKIFCFGVLQHCPSPQKAFLSLIPYLKSGGEIVIDIYDLSFRTFVNPKYWLRPFTRRISPEKLYEIVQVIVPIIFPIKTWITENVPFGKYFTFFIPVAYHKGFLPHVDKLTNEQLLEWSILDTFDKFAPAYDKPQRINTVKRWFEDAELENVDICRGPNGINGKGIKL
jgi:SAM-dependent methyltransferase